MKTRFAMAGILALCSVSVSAKEKYRDVVNAHSEEAFAQLSDNVHRDMAAGGRYEFVTPGERAKVDNSLGAMTALFRERHSVDKMSEPEKVALFNNQEVVNSILTKRDSDRVICENRVPVGSHIPKTSCHTYGQEEEARRGTNHEIEALKHTQCITAGPKDRHCR